MFISSDNIYYNDIHSAINDSKSVEVIINDNRKLFIKGDEDFENILNCFNDMVNNSHQMPALGVSIHELALEKMKEGVWVEFNFNNILYCNDMPFESLLIEVVPNFGGFNIVRKYKDRYDGRCFYIDLVNSDMSNLYSVLQSLY